VCADNDRISEFSVALMAIDAEHLGIPDTEYKGAWVRVACGMGGHGSFVEAGCKV
jgi:hypothetical protein